MVTDLPPRTLPEGPEGLAVLDLLPDAVIVVSGDGTVEHCNRMAARLLGVPARDLVGQRASEAIVVTDEAGSDWWTWAHPLDVDPRLAPRSAEQELELRDVHGRARPVSLTASRQAAADGRVSRLFLCLRRAERRRRLEAATSELVSTVSHEIRSPLTSVKGFTKTLLAKWDRFTDEQRRQMLATIDEDADRVTRLLGELLDVSRIDAGRLPLRRQMVDVPLIARRVLDRAARVADGSQLVTNLGGDVPKLYADPDKVEQIFTNLVENALKYGQGTVAVSADVDDDAVRFTVADQGPGIDPAHLRHIFTKFFRRAGERRSGTGLGLYITKGLVEAHGGRIWAESTPGGGAVFHFTLPRGGLELAGVDLSRLS